MVNPPNSSEKIILQSLATYTTAKKCNLLVRKQRHSFCVMQALLVLVARNKFYVSCERVFRPDLIGKTVVSIEIK
jgi:hypothetical protein